MNRSDKLRKICSVVGLAAGFIVVVSILFFWLRQPDQIEFNVEQVSEQVSEQLSLELHSADSDQPLAIQSQIPINPFEIRTHNPTTDNSHTESDYARQNLRTNSILDDSPVLDDLPAGDRTARNVGGRPTDPVWKAHKEAFLSTVNVEDIAGQEMISGRVISDSGNHRSNIKIVAVKMVNPDSAVPTLNLTPPRTMLALSNEDGKFTFVGLDKGQYRLSIPGSDEFSPLSTKVKSGARSINLVTYRLRQTVIGGTVSDVYGAPLEGVMVRISPGRVETLTDTGGNFELPLIVNQENEYHLVFIHELYRKLHQSINGTKLLSTQPEPYMVVANLEYNELRSSIFGILSEAYGNAIADQQISIHARKTRSQFKTRSDYAGQYIFEDLPAGDDYRIAVAPDANNKKYKLLSKEYFQLGTSPLQQDLVLQEHEAFVYLTGKVVSSDGIPIPNFEFKIKPKAAGRNATHAVSNSAGEYFANLPAGPVQIVSLGEPRLTVVNIHLNPGQPKELNIPVDWGTHSVSGYLIDSEGYPVQGARVTLNWAKRSGQVLSQTARSTRTDSRGAFSFANLGEGRHSLSVSDGAIHPLRRTIEVGRDQHVSVTAERII